MSFPVEKCDICDAPISDPSEGLIAAHQFARTVRWLYAALAPVGAIPDNKNEDAAWAQVVVDDAICKSLHDSRDGDFVRNVTRSYFYQFSDEYNDDAAGGGGGVSLRDYVRRELQRFDDVHRLKTFLSRPVPTRDLYLLVHWDCLPESIRDAVYRIELTRIDSPDKAIQWTMHLSEKTSWNTDGWMAMLASLFGREAL